jgi:hypothetical protein
MNSDMILKMLNNKFNKLTVLGFSHKEARAGHYRSYWKCKCDCGKGVLVEHYHLVDGHTKSCGCIKVYKRASGDSGLKYLYKIYRAGAKSRDKKFDLTIEDVKIITSKNCYYCGEEPSGTSIMSKSRNDKFTEYRSYKYNGIDRVDSNKGYEKGNVVPCCKWCNIAKSNNTAEEFKEHISKMYRFLKETGWPTVTDKSY